MHAVPDGTFEEETGDVAADFGMRLDFVGVDEIRNLCVRGARVERPTHFATGALDERRDVGFRAV